MKSSWLHKGKRQRLIVFCNGWGMDSDPFRSIATEQYDVLNLYDFRQLDDVSDILAELNGYSERILVGWSMGVWVAQKLFTGKEHVFNRKIAINGTLCPIHEDYGIPPELFAGTMAAWSELSRSKFYRRVCGSRNVNAQFIESQPERSLTDQQEELSYYLEFADCIGTEKSIFTEIIVSENDRIVPTAHQLAYWGRDNVTYVGGSHFLFYDWKCWDDLLVTVTAGKR